MNTPTKVMWRRVKTESFSHEFWWDSRTAFIERQVKHAPAWLNEWDVRLLAAKEWELK